MDFEWDDVKAAANYRKHGVSFETARRVFDDPFAVEWIDPRNDEYGEDRFLITGLANGPPLTVVYVERHDRIRIISARHATRAEHDNYYRQNAQE